MGMGAGEKADDEFVLHSGVTGWMALALDFCCY